MYQRTIYSYRKHERYDNIHVGNQKEKNLAYAYYCKKGIITLSGRLVMGLVADRFPLVTEKFPQE